MFCKSGGFVLYMAVIAKFSLHNTESTQKASIKILLIPLLFSVHHNHFDLLLPFSHY